MVKLMKNWPMQGPRCGIMRIKKLTLSIKACKDCPYLYLDENLEYYRCSNADKWIAYTYELPDWCPLEEEVTSP